MPYVTASRHYARGTRFYPQPQARPSNRRRARLTRQTGSSHGPAGRYASAVSARSILLIVSPAATTA